MPLLKKRSFEEKASAPEFLRDDEEVFYCEVTNEIFRNYEEFAERMLLCTSMVWTCAMTGKSNLTYEEALESEENARKSIKEFPVELRIPVLYVASKTKRTGFTEMAEDVFLYCKDRYFIGEKLETFFTSNKWVDSHVLQVLAPSAEEIKKASAKNGSTEKHSNPHFSLYKYEIEHLDSEDQDISEIMIVDYNQMRRRKALFNREKCKLFLKQYVEQDSNHHYSIKASTLKEFGISTMKFDQIFSGPEPNFDASRKFERRSDPKKPVAVNGKKSRQETMAKYLTKLNGNVKNNGAPPVNNSEKKKSNSELLEQMEKRKEEFERMKQLKEEQKLVHKQKQRESYLQMLSQMREWNKAKEDLKLENQQVLPSFPPIKSKIPDKYLGEVLTVLEFIKSFEKILKSKNFFQSGVTFETIERALLEQEVAGPFIDLIQMLLTALFREQEEENAEYSMQLAKPTFLSKIDINHMSFEDGAKYATVAAKWPKDKQGLTVRNLPLYALTVSEVLRIHLLSSGAKLQETGERGRFAQRGGYNYTDDPGLYLRLRKPHILRSLAVKNVVQLRLKDKVAILTCLTDQLLTYADIRDTIEDRIEKNRQVKIDLRSAQAAEKKKENEYNTAKWHMKREAKIKKQDPKETARALSELGEAEEKRKLQNEKDMEAHMRSAYDKEVILGMDRAFRKYYKLESLPGLLVDTAEDHPGSCQPEPSAQIPELINAEKSTVTSYLRKVMKKLNGSDKENSPTKKSPKKINGDVASVEIDVAESCRKLLMCSADDETCVVHSSKREGPKWKFLPHVEMFDALVGSLNKRGLREGELLQTLQNDKETLTKYIKQTPVQQLNADLDVIQEEDAKSRVATRAKKSYMDANFGFPAGTSIEEILQNTLTDDILEMEEKIYSGSLGQLHVKNREAWRNTLLTKDYENFNREIVRRTYVENDNVKMEVDEEEEEVGPGGKGRKYFNVDPGTFLGPSKASDSDSDEDDWSEEEHKEEVKKAVECLAIALAQVAQAVEPKFLQKPLGDSSDKNLATYVPSRNRLDNWEQSLLTSTSFSQVFLHYSTLDSCVMWTRSTLLAKCKICRRQKDSENMLLCDSCNLGHHLYCLKPKLTSIPKGDWFCDRCTAAKEKERRKAGTEIMPKKKRRLFKEEEQEEEEEEEEVSVKQESDEENDEESEEEEGSEEAEEEDSSENEDDEESSVKVDLCRTCNSGGVLISCEECSTCYHKECVDPPMRRAKPNWVCNDCKGVSKEDKEEDDSEHKDNNNRQRRRSKKGETESKAKDKMEEESSDSDDYPLALHAAGGMVNNERRCAAKARHNIYNFVKSLRRLSSSGDDSDEESHHIHKQRKRSHRRESGRDDLPLHNAALQDLLSELMKHRDAWPFLRPVQKNEVPDYHDVISQPMDFGTIKYKLNMGEYNTDSQLMHDASLVFANCSTYNEADSEIYRCGEALLDFFRNKCVELGLKIPGKNHKEEETNKKRRKK